jgi:hypothetical protein
VMERGTVAMIVLIRRVSSVCCRHIVTPIISGRMRRSVVFPSDINTLNVRSTPRSGHSVHCDSNTVADTNADAILSGIHIMFLHMRGPNFDIRFRLAREAI